GWPWQQTKAPGFGTLTKAPGFGTPIHEHTLTLNHGGGQNGVTRTSDSTHPGLCGTFCFTCLACQVASDMNECCLCGTSVAMRTLYRTRYGIPGSICDDYMVTLFCPLCSLCQIKRDINRRRANRTF
uniref:Placenta associated 8 n=1 Tax=Capra hircus TaxID=9925 RepID=A0A8C2PHM8_CAPHI